MRDIYLLYIEDEEVVGVYSTYENAEFEVESGERYSIVKRRIDGPMPKAQTWKTK